MSDSNGFKKLEIGFDNPIFEELMDMRGFELIALVKIGEEVIGNEHFEEITSQVDNIIMDVARKVADIADGPVEQITMMLMLGENFIANAIGYRHFLELRLQVSEMEGDDDDPTC